MKTPLWYNRQHSIFAVLAIPAIHSEIERLEKLGNDLMGEMLSDMFDQIGIEAIAIIRESRVKGVISHF